MKTSELLRTAAVVAALFLLGALASHCQRTAWDAERTGLLEAADSLRVATRQDSARAAERLAQVTDSLTGVVSAAQDARQRAIATADRLRAQRLALRGASAPVDTAQPDSGAVLDEALALCEDETGALRTALTADSLALGARVAEVAALRGSLTVATHAAAALRVSNADLAASLAAADPPCRLLLWRCPSRTVVAIASAAGGAGVTFLIMR